MAQNLTCIPPERPSVVLYAAAASAIGRSHRSRNGQCEDAWAIDASTVGIPCKAVVVCDGAGSREFGRQGARIASRIAARWLTEYAAFLFAGMSEEEIAHKLVSVIQRTICRYADAEGLDAWLSDFACTLVGVVMDTEGHWLAIHMGDGGIVGLEDGTSPCIVSAPSKGEFANVTYFVTDSDAEENLRVYSDQRNLHAFALFSDGVENSLVQAAAQTIAPAVPQLLTWLDDNPETEVTEALQSSLEEAFTRKTSDDCTLALISRVPAILPSTSDEEAPKRQARRRYRSAKPRSCLNGLRLRQYLSRKRGG